MRKAILLLVFSLLAIGARRRSIEHPGAPTFSREVVRIFQQHCQSCHRPGDIAPFALITYRDAAAVAPQIKYMTQHRLMPPWKPAQGCGDFVGERTMSQQEIDTIAQWVDAGAPEGRKEDLPPALPLASDWVFGTPDVVVAMRKPFTPPADRDEYRCFSLPVDAQQDLWVSTVDFRPGDRATVHHIVPYLDITGESAQLDPAGDGFTCFGGPLIDTSDVIGAWSPGARPVPLPEGTAVRIPKGARVLMQVHYHPHFGKVGVDRTEVGLYLAKSEVKKQLRYDIVANTGLVIPANASNHRVDATKTLFNDVEIVSIYPHMHLLGQRMKVEAVLPNGTTQCLVNIEDYDFNWQGSYVFKTPLKLPRGARLKIESYYDNSTNNLQNPNAPPVEVRWGEASTDEMCVALFGYTL